MFLPLGSSMPGVVSGTLATSFQHILWQLHEVDHPLPIYRWEIALFGSLGMARLPVFWGRMFPVREQHGRKL